MNHDTPLVWYVTPHGNGHAARTCDIVSSFNHLFPEFPVILVSRHSTSFLRPRIPSLMTTFRQAAFDTGLMQNDSVSADLDASRQAVDEFMTRSPALRADETRWLSDIRAGAVVSDIPALPLESAATAGIPALAVGNFSWNWIYENLSDPDPAWSRIAEGFRRGYNRCDLLLRLPLHEPMTAFPRIEDIPLVASPGKNRRLEISRSTGCDPSARWVLIGFGSLNWDTDALQRLASLKDHVFLSVRPLAWDAPSFVSVDQTEVSFSDALASCDVVLTKPGFGIVSEAIVNAKPMVYAARDDWPETSVLVGGIRRFVRAAPITARQLYSGDIEDALHTAMNAPPPPENAPAGGATIAARRIREWLPSRSR